MSYFSPKGYGGHEEQEIKKTLSGSFKVDEEARFQGLCDHYVQSSQGFLSLTHLCETPHNQLGVSKLDTGTSELGISELRISHFGMLDIRLLLSSACSAKIGTRLSISLACSATMIEFELGTLGFRIFMLGTSSSHSSRTPIELDKGSLKA
ncbi:hypothetical protein U1Q18_014020 [Sarracenia purpurea var. burkii]